MKDNLQKIKDSSTLFRDVGTGAVLNKDESAYDNYLRTYNKLKSQAEEFESLKQTVNSLSSDISEIKNLLTKFVGKNYDD